MIINPMYTRRPYPSSQNGYTPHAQQESKRQTSAIPTPAHRHAGPSGPWPWMNIKDTLTKSLDSPLAEVEQGQLKVETPPVPPSCDHSACEGNCWKDYPRSRFPNWTESQVKKSGIAKIVKGYDKTKPCRIHLVDVNSEGEFKNSKTEEVPEGKEDGFWIQLISAQRPEYSRVRALFIEDLSGPVLQMLGAKYNIEPFFFSSSLNWIPTTFQEEVLEGVGDHITITLKFVTSLGQNDAIRLINANRDRGKKEETTNQRQLITEAINTDVPLVLRSSGHVLAQNLLSVHLVRNKDRNTIISYHPSSTPELPTTPAEYLHDRICFAGQSVYWQNIFRQSPDPTFVLLTYIWHAIYAWDEAFEDLYKYISTLEMTEIDSSKIWELSRDLHTIRSHLLHYGSLLRDLEKTVKFVHKTHNPAMAGADRHKKELSDHLMARECENLLNEVQRLDKNRYAQDKRLKNVINMVFSTLTIQDSFQMKKMTEAAVRDSAAMKQIAYLTMAFLPGSFVATIFGMNVKTLSPDTLGSLGIFFAIAIPLTVVTSIVIRILQIKLSGSSNKWIRAISDWRFHHWRVTSSDGGNPAQKAQNGSENGTRDEKNRDVQEQISVHDSLERRQHAPQ